MLHFLMGIKSFKNWKRIAKSAANKSFILIRFITHTHTHTCLSYECVMVWVTPEKGSAPQRLQVSWNIFYTIFICPQSFALLLFSLFTIFFSHFCCERCSTRRVLQKQIRRKLNGFVVFDTALPPTDQGENEKRDEINVEVNEKKIHAEREEKLILSFPFPV